MNHTGERERALTACVDWRGNPGVHRGRPWRKRGPEELSVWISQMSGRGTVPDVQEAPGGAAGPAGSPASLSPSPSLPPPSMSGHRVPPPAETHFYSATKYAVTALTEGLRQELREAQSHIRATVRGDLTPAPSHRTHSRPQSLASAPGTDLPGSAAACVALLSPQVPACLCL